MPDSAINFTWSYSHPNYYEISIDWFGKCREHITIIKRDSWFLTDKKYNHKYINDVILDDQGIFHTWLMLTSRLLAQ